jgi:hypothetical protein
MAAIQVPKVGEEFEYVIIPADTDRPIEARKFAQVSLEDDQFIKMIKAYFAAASPESGVDMEMLLSQINQHAKRDIASSMDANTVSQLMSMTSVDILSISVPMKENGYVGVSLYCDDKGKAKNLPVNERATKVGMACGLVGQTFNGDVFFSRMFDDGEDHWFRMDFGMSDVSSSADWIKRTADQMARKLQSGATSLSSLSSNFLSNISGGANAPAIDSGEDIESTSGEGNGFKWTQNGEEIDISIPIPAEFTKPTVKVELKSKSVNVRIDNKLVVGGDLIEDIITDESTWSFSRQDNNITVTLWKKNPKTNWTKIFK